jgi:hypothetical protein
MLNNIRGFRSLSASVSVFSDRHSKGTEFLPDTQIGFAKTLKRLLVHNFFQSNEKLTFLWNERNKEKARMQSLKLQTSGRYIC